ncbi:hypothetical protein [Paraglaciecola sp. L3A3]|uniref:hypothetical protein n=1 Tax=Paraglaciecola sp. L3A3 TaxID=2686358 RepID=UPI00131CB3AC|nr:hypothetical protein [Paraglaciecola sp. L3A3]
MKKFIATLALFVGLQANAGIIGLELSDTNTNVGENVQVTLSGTGFDAFDTFNLEVEFDTSLFSFNPLSVGGDLFDAIPFIFEVTEQAYGIAISFIDFIPFVGGDFTIATFDLTAMAKGDTDFELANIEAYDYFAPIDAAEEANLDVSIAIADSTTSTEVSAPATLGLFALATFGICALRRKA